ncbi:MAG TPA: DUF4124 domain-containing protein [Noviherbaspirillum sp.]
MKAVSVVVLGLAFGISAPALAIYKCESEGRTTYSDIPCPGGKSLEVPITAASDSDAAGRAAAREKKALASLEKERHRREAVEARELKTANRAAAARRKKCDNLARRQKRADDAVRTSVGKANERAKLNARRVAEDYEAACGRWPERELGLAR